MDRTPEPRYADTAILLSQSVHCRLLQLLKSARTRCEMNDAKSAGEKIDEATKLLTDAGERTR